MRLLSLTKIHFPVYLLFAILAIDNCKTFAGGGGGGGGGSPSPTSNTNSAAPSMGSASATLGGTILAYQSLKFLGTNIADQIAKTIGNKNGTCVYITTTPPNSGGLQATYFFEKNLFSLLITNYLNNDDFQSAFSDATKPFVPTPSVPGQLNILGGLIPSETAGDLVSAATTVLAQFRTAITATDNSIVPDNLGLLPSLCARLRSNNITPITADFYVDGSPLFDKHSLLSTIMYAAEIRAYGTIFTNDTKNSPSSIKRIALLNATYDNLFTNLTTLPLASFIPLDLLYSTLSQDDAYLLYISNDYAVGEMRVKSNPIIDIFFDGPRTSFLGGAGVSYFLYKGAGATPILAEHLDGYDGYQQFSKFTWFHFVRNDLDK